MWHPLDSGLMSCHPHPETSGRRPTTNNYRALSLFLSTTEYNSTDFLLIPGFPKVKPKQKRSREKKRGIEPRIRFFPALIDGQQTKGRDATKFPIPVRCVELCVFVVLWTAHLIWMRIRRNTRSEFEVSNQSDHLSARNKWLWHQRRCTKIEKGTAGTARITRRPDHSYEWLVLLIDSLHHIAITLDWMIDWFVCLRGAGWTNLCHRNMAFKSRKERWIDMLASLSVYRIIWRECRK